jgi:creatinine amidohydrolase/Fe(II)-dependent formamide hydrolase-like protein
MTSLMLYLCPDKVNLDRAADFLFPGHAHGAPQRCVDRIPEGSQGSVGQPEAATAETGRAIFDHICRKIRAKVFLASEDDA